MNIERHFCLDESPHFHMMELDTIDSTNNFLRHYKPLRPCRLTLASAEFQTAGRGADTNSWESEKGKNLIFSLLIYPRNIEAVHVFSLSEVLALSVRDALSEFVPGFKVKWPNDIYYADEKVAGLLIENDLVGRFLQRAIMGVGININQTTFRSDAPNPCALAKILGHEVERRFVLERVVEHFNRYYGMLETGAYGEVHELYLKHLYRKGEMCSYRDENGDFCACLENVEPSGHLCLRLENGDLRRYAFKEVSFVL